MTYRTIGGRDSAGTPHASRLQTKTMRQEPDRCTDNLCRELVACDEHIRLVGVVVMEMLAHPERGEWVTRSECYGGHD